MDEGKKEAIDYLMKDLKVRLNYEKKMPVFTDLDVIKYLKQTVEGLIDSRIDFTDKEKQQKIYSSYKEKMNEFGFVFPEDLKKTTEIENSQLLSSINMKCEQTLEVVESLSRGRAKALEITDAMKNIEQSISNIYTDQGHLKEAQADIKEYMNVLAKYQVNIEEKIANTLSASLSTRDLFSANIESLVNCINKMSENSQKRTIMIGDTIHGSFDEFEKKVMSRLESAQESIESKIDFWEELARRLAVLDSDNVVLRDKDSQKGMTEEEVQRRLDAVPADHVIALDKGSKEEKEIEEIINVGRNHIPKHRKPSPRSVEKDDEREEMLNYLSKIEYPVTPYDIFLGLQRELNSRSLKQDILLKI